MGNLSLIMVAAFLVGFSYVGFRTRSVQENANTQAIYAVNMAQRKLTGASGINRALSTLTVTPTYRTRVSGLITGTLRNGTFSVKVLDNIDDPTLDVSQLRVMCVTQVDTLRPDTTVVLLNYPSFAKFAYISNSDGSSSSPIYFVTGDTLRGPVSTNGYFSMMGNPYFMNQVSSAQVYQTSPFKPYYTNGSTNPTFLIPPQWGVPAMPLPPNTSIQRNAADSNGVVYNNTTLYLQFLAAGTYQTRTATSGAGSSWVVHSAPANGVIYVGHPAGTGGTGYNVYVQGTLSGRYTLCSQGNIYITGDVLYNNPDVNTSTDMLGLVASMDCQLQNNTAGDRTIMAHIMTLNPSTSTTSNFWNTNYNNLGSGYLHILGGLAQNHRGAVGTSGSPHYGYFKDYKYDKRLDTTSPPTYPLTSVLQQIYYWE